MYHSFLVKNKYPYPQDIFIRLMKQNNNVIGLPLTYIRGDILDLIRQTAVSH